MNKAMVLLIGLSLTGCSRFFPAQTQYQAPTRTDDVAKIRLIGPPMSYALYLDDPSGQEKGGWVMKHNRFMNPFLGSTKDIGLPKVTGKNYKDDYFETLLRPDLPTTIYHSLYQGCSVSLAFTPEKKKIYEAHISYADKSGYCVLYLKEVAFDSVNAIYVEKDVTQ